MTDNDELEALTNTNAAEVVVTQADCEIADRANTIWAEQVCGPSAAAIAAALSRLRHNQGRPPSRPPSPHRKDTPMTTNEALPVSEAVEPRARKGSYSTRKSRLISGLNEAEIGELMRLPVGEGRGVAAQDEAAARSLYNLELAMFTGKPRRYRLTDKGVRLRAALSLQPERTITSNGGLMEAIMAEVEKATRKFPTWPTRIIDAGNVVSEEAGELAKACLQVTYEKGKETLAGVRMEAIQTAAMCVRFLASIDRYDTTPGDQHVQGLAKEDCLKCGTNPHAIELCDDCEHAFLASLPSATALSAEQAGGGE